MNRYLQNAWDKYGEENFEFFVVHECSEGEHGDAVSALERAYIKKYKNAGLSYNIGDGGDGGNNLGRHLSDETKQKIGEKNRANMLGRKLSDETRKKMSDSQIARYASWSPSERQAHGRRSAETAVGYHWSEEARQRFSEKQNTKPNGAKYDVETVRKIRFMHEIDGLSTAEIADALGMQRHTVYLIATYRRWKNV